MQQKESTEKMFDAEFGGRVRRYREIRGMSQRDLAGWVTAVGATVDASGISRIEKGTRTAKVFEAVALAEALDVPLNYLIRGQSAAVDLNEIRYELVTYLKNLHSAVFSVSSAVSDIEDMLAEDRELLAELKSGDREPPDVAEDFPAWVAENVRRRMSQRDADSIVLNGNVEQAARLREMFHTIIDAQIPHVTDEDLRAMGVFD